MKELFSIGEMAKLYGLNYRTLRYYDDIGLLKPEYINPETNYRYYSTRQFEALNTILYLRGLDVPVQRIREFLERRNLGQLMELFEEQRTEIRRERERLEQIDRKLQSCIHRLDDTLREPLGKMEEKHLPPRMLAVLREEFALKDDIEYPVQEIGGKDPKNFAVFPGKIGLSISPEQMLAGCYHIYSSVFMIVEPDDRCEGEKVLLPEGDYLTFRFCGMHQDAEQYYPRLLGYLEEHGYELAGETLEFALIDYCLSDDKQSYVTELQLPFRKLC
ncbi:MAG: MerR family transcriptional regulator [Clostridiales bacterium]|nr:MerR family transcriptional regulator [Clostridiales bacterium]